MRSNVVPAARSALAFLAASRSRATRCCGVSPPGVEGVADAVKAWGPEGVKRVASATVRGVIVALVVGGWWWWWWGGGEVGSWGRWGSLVVMMLARLNATKRKKWSRCGDLAGMEGHSVFNVTVNQTHQSGQSDSRSLSPRTVIFPCNPKETKKKTTLFPTNSVPAP